MPAKKSVLLALLATAAALVSLPGVASAQAPASGDARVAAAVNRITAHRHSAADIALVKTRPDIARQVPDPDGVSVVFRSSGDLKLAKSTAVPTGIAPFGPPSTALENCAGAAELWITQTSLLGFVIWRWSHKVEACSDNVNVTRFIRRSDFLVIADGTIAFKELVRDIQGATPRAWTSSSRQRHLEQCFAIPLTGCFHIYPWSTIYLYADHTWNYQWGA